MPVECLVEIGIFTADDHPVLQPRRVQQVLSIRNIGGPVPGNGQDGAEHIKLVSQVPRITAPACFSGSYSIMGIGNSEPHRRQATRIGEHPVV